MRFRRSRHDEGGRVRETSSRKFGYNYIKNPLLKLAPGKIFCVRSKLGDITSFRWHPCGKTTRPTPEFTYSWQEST